MTDYRTEIQKLEDKIAALKKEQAKLEAMPLDQQLAIRLHELQCFQNHTDACSWGYESSNGKTDWEHGYAHSAYLLKARKVIGKCVEHGISPNIFVDLLVIAK